MVTQGSRANPRGDGEGGDSPGALGGAVLARSMLMPWGPHGGQPRRRTAIGRPIPVVGKWGAGRKRRGLRASPGRGAHGPARAWTSFSPPHRADPLTYYRDPVP